MASSLPMILRLTDDLDCLNTVLSPFYPQPSASFHRLPSWTNQIRRLEKEVGKLSPIGKDGFQVSMDVTQFKPSELQVKVTDNHIVVEGKHEEREDEHGFITRHFVRRYSVPKGYDPEKVASTLSSDGVLTVSIPKPQPLEDKAKERVIQIQQTGPAALNVKENMKDEKTNKEKSKDEKTNKEKSKQ